jgi:hypothetical protein
MEHTMHNHYLHNAQITGDLMHRSCCNDACIQHIQAQIAYANKRIDAMDDSIRLMDTSARTLRRTLHAQLHLK